MAKPKTAPRPENISDQLAALRTPLDNIQLLEGNPRRGDVDAVARSYETFGQRKPIVVKRTGENEAGPTGTVIAGNHQLQAARQLGWTEIAAVFVDDDDSTAKAYALADNRTAELGGYDEEALLTMLRETAIDESMLEATGWTAQDLLDLQSGHTRGTEPNDADSVPEPPKTAVTRSGDVWILGRHRVICGDATDVSAWTAVLNGSRATLCFTSPPYNAGTSASLSGNKASATSGNFYSEHVDDLVSSDYLELLNDYTKLALLHAEVTVTNIQQLAGNKTAVLSHFHSFQRHFVDMAIWDKGNAAPAMAAEVMNSRFEYLLILDSEEDPSRRIRTASFRGNVDNVYQAPPQRSNEYAKIHGATFPVHLPTWVIETLDGSKKGSVIDPFCGTGTTIIAAHDTGRTGYGIEMDPIYVDVTCQRFQEHTGVLPVLDSTGEPHDFTPAGDDE